MKILTFICCFYLTAANAQIINFDFIRWRNKEIKTKLQAHKERLTYLLKRNGFNDSDTVNVYFHNTQEYILVLCNDTSKSQMLYRQFIIYMYEVNNDIRYLRFYYFTIFVRAEKDSYYRTSYKFLSFTNNPVKRSDETFIKHLNRREKHKRFFSVLNLII